eukprot:5824225-Amphidinium_carterae.1
MFPVGGIDPVMNRGEMVSWERPWCCGQRKGGQPPQHGRSPVALHRAQDRGCMCKSSNTNLQTSTEQVTSPSKEQPKETVHQEIDNCISPVPS